MCSMAVHIQLPQGNERQQIFLALWISVISTIAMAFHHPKQVKIDVLVDKVTDSIVPCLDPLFR